MKTIYLDNAATTQIDKEVLRAMLPFLKKSYGNPSSIHSLGEEAKRAIDESRRAIAKSMNAEQDEIIFTSGATESNNLAIIGATNSAKRQGKNHIISCVTEHPSVLETCRHLEKSGVSVTYLKVGKKGFIDMQELENSINKKTFLVTIMHANNEIGTIQDIEKIGKICNEKGVIFHSDAAQSFTKAPIDVKKMNIDMLSINAHKIHGPKGVGALFVKKGTQISKIIHGGPQENNLRAGTENVAGIVGFGKATSLMKKTDIERMAFLRDKMIKELLKIPNTKLNGASGKKRLCNNINVSFYFVEGESILLHLDSKGICVSTGSACSQRELKPSYVLTAIGLKPEISHGSIRFSISKFTTEKEIEYTLEKVKDIIENLRRISNVA